MRGFGKKAFPAARQCNQFAGWCFKQVMLKPKISPIVPAALTVFFLGALFQHVPAQLPAERQGLIEDLYLAKANSEGKAGERVEEFLTTDIPIFCVVQLVSAETATVKLNFVAVKVAGVKPESHVVSVSYTTKEGESRVNFSGRPQGLWVAGRYRADIFIEGKLEQSIEFDIKRAASVNGVTRFNGSRPPAAVRPNKPKN